MRTLWGERAPQRGKRAKRKAVPQPTITRPYSITGNDCVILGHTLNHYDLAGCSSCIDCQVRVFCPACTPKHPTDENAVPVMCERHSERTVSA